MSIRVKAGTMLFGWINSARHKTYACLVIEFGDCESVEVCYQKPIFKKSSAILNGENILLKSYTK